MVWRFFTVLLLASVLIPGCNSRKTEAHREVELGKSMFQEGRYEESIQHYRRALELDPSLVNVRLALLQMSPGSIDQKEANEAINVFKAAIRKNPSDFESVRALAYVYFQLKRYDEAKEQYLTATKLEPRNPENYFSAAVIDWTQSYQLRMGTRASLRLSPKIPFIDQSECGAIREQNLGRVQEGIDLLQKALDLRPTFDDAMNYMNLLYRERAEIQCGDRAAYNSDMKAAEAWVSSPAIKKIGSGP